MRYSIKPDHVELVPSIGEDISNAASDAIKLVSRFNSPVRFKFNAHLMEANVLSTVDGIVLEYGQKCDAAYEAYLASPEYAENKRLDAIEVSKHQATVNQLMLELPSAIRDTKVLCAWLYRLTPAVDRVDVKWDREFVMNTIKNAGYKTNAGVISDEMSEDSKRTGRALLFSSHVAFGNYLIGQALSCMESGMGPHPVFQTFYERDYLPMLGK